MCKKRLFCYNNSMKTEKLQQKTEVICPDAFKGSAARIHDWERLVIVYNGRSTIAEICESQEVKATISSIKKSIRREKH